MKILIIVAMQKELDLFLPLLENAEEFEIQGHRYHRGNIGGHHVTLGKCGIGKVNSALSTLRLIQSEHPDLVVNSGVAGGAAEDIHPLDVVVANAVAYHDVWCGPGTQYGAADGFPVRMHPDGDIVNKAVESIPGVRKGLICSGDQFIDNPQKVDEIWRRFPDVLAVDMESASVLQTCISEGVRCAVLRVISDSPRAGESFGQYVNFWEDAPKATFEALSVLLRRLSEE